MGLVGFCVMSTIKKQELSEISYIENRIKSNLSYHPLKCQTFKVTLVSLARRGLEKCKEFVVSFFTDSAAVVSWNS